MCFLTSFFDSFQGLFFFLLKQGNSIVKLFYVIFFKFSDFFGLNDRWNCELGGHWSTHGVVTDAFVEISWVLILNHKRIAAGLVRLGARNVASVRIVWIDNSIKWVLLPDVALRCIIQRILVIIINIWCMEVVNWISLIDKPFLRVYGVANICWNVGIFLFSF